MRLILFSLLFACGEEDNAVQPSLVNEQVEQPVYPKTEDVKQVAPDEDVSTEKVEETTSQEEAETQGD